MAELRTRPHSGKPVVATKQATYNEWLAEHLPRQSSKVYFVDLLGTAVGALLARKQTPVEIVNDLSGEVAAFWRTMRNSPAALNSALTAKQKRPTSRNGVSTDDLRQAVSFVRSELDGNAALDGAWLRRVRNLKLDCRPPLVLLDYWRTFPQAVIVCDLSSASLPADETASLIAAADDEVVSVAKIVFVSNKPEPPVAEGWRNETYPSVENPDRHLWANFTLADRDGGQPVLLDG